MRAGELFKLAYSEGPESTFTRGDLTRRTDALLRKVRSLPVVEIPVGDLSWNLLPEFGNVDMRGWSGDTAVPLIVTQTKDGLDVLDGLHRLTKLVEQGAKTVKARVVPESLLEEVPVVEKTALDPLPHQKRVAERLRDSPGMLVVHGLGSGKTLTSINAARELGLPLIAIVPASLRENYKKELAAAKFTGPAEVISYEEAIRRKDDPEFKARAAQSLVVYDEASRISRQESARSELPRLLPAKKTLLLTGTPAKNSPNELGMLLESASGGRLRRDVVGEHIRRRKIYPSLWGWMTGQRTGTEEHPQDLPGFAEKAKPYVDFYEPADRKDYPDVVESVVEVPLSDRQLALYRYMMAKSPGLWAKVRAGIQPEKSEVERLKAFLIGPRQAVNSAAPFASRWKPADDSKIQAMANEIEKRYKTDKDFRGVSYSSFLEAGVKPLSAELERRGIPHGVFTGAQNDSEKKKMVEDYNAGRLPVLLLSGAGAEGISLKKTKLLQVGESAWNDASVRQVIGRAVRYKSHSDLPKDQRVVEVQKFRAKVPKSFVQWAFGLDSDKSADEYVADIAEGKKKLTEKFVGSLRTGDIYRSASTPTPSASPSTTPPTFDLPAAG